MIDSKQSSHQLWGSSAGRRVRGALCMAVMALVSLSPRPAIAAYCGSSTDTSEIENLALARGPSDKSRIMNILVVQDYARVDIQFKGRLTEYYVKDCGQWLFSGYTLPSDAPSAVATQLSSFVTRDDGGTQCLNPHFVNHPSSP